MSNQIVRSLTIHHKGGYNISGAFRLLNKSFSLNRLSKRMASQYIRNIAIIAHVDHGKTTLVDCLLRQTGAIQVGDHQSRVMDSNDLERERGITILAKCTSIERGQYRINIVDTPGHADFGGEVERALTMVDGVILLVDATEGPMAQTKFVLSKAIKRGLIPIVVQNKADRVTARCDEVDCEVMDLFMNLDCNDQQLNYPTIYASAKEGWARLDAPNTSIKNVQEGDMTCLFDMIIKNIPPPSVSVSGNPPFSLLVNNVEYNPFVGKCVLGRIESGTINIGDKIKAMRPTGSISEEGRVTRMFLRHGLKQVDITRAAAGQIVSIAGVSRATVNDTIGGASLEMPLPSIPVDPPTVSMTFMVNGSPLAGSEGKSLTKSTLEERLNQECENNVSLKVETGEDPDSFKVSGRGELQLGVLIEMMRREGYELSVSPPKVVLKEQPDGTVFEPVEEITIDVDSEYSGVVIEKISKKKAEITKMIEGINGKFRIIAKCPTRGLIGFGSELKNDTKGTGVINRAFLAHELFRGPMEQLRKGTLISMSSGLCTAYALADLEGRGKLFVSPGTVVYPGMIIGENSRGMDLQVNPCRAKLLTNVRSSTKEEFFRLSPALSMSLEEYISYMSGDEILEITPKNIRLRKADQNPANRKKKISQK